jgi:hypothetical protein
MAVYRTVLWPFHSCPSGCHNLVVENSLRLFAAAAAAAAVQDIFRPVIALLPRPAFYGLACWQPAAAGGRGMAGMADNTNIGVIMSLLNESIAP